MITAVTIIRTGGRLTKDTSPDGTDVTLHPTDPAHGLLKMNSVTICHWPVRLVVPGCLLAAALLLSACSADQAIIWEAHSRSPDGHYQANAATTQQSGPGNAALYTVVKLSQRDDDEGFDIVTLSHKSTRELTGGAVTMRWVDGKTLNVAYEPSATVDFQAIKGAGVTIELVPRSR